MNVIVCGDGEQALLQAYELLKRRDKREQVDIDSSPCILTRYLGSLAPSESTVIFHGPREEHYHSYYGSVIQSLSKVREQSFQGMVDAIESMFPNTEAKNTGLLLAHAHCVTLVNQEHHFIITFRLEVANERGRTSLFASIKSGFYHDLGSWEEFQIAMLELKSLLQKNFPRLSWDTAFQNCQFCNNKLNQEDFQEHFYTHENRCLSCQESYKRELRLSSKRQKAYAVEAKRQKLLDSGLKVARECPNCAEKFEISKAKNDSQKVLYCSGDCKKQSKFLHSERKATVYTEEALKKCLSHSGPNCAIFDCPNPQPEVQNKWHVCKTHYPRVKQVLIKHTRNLFETFKAYA